LPIYLLGKTRRTTEHAKPNTLFTFLCRMQNILRKSWVRGFRVFCNFLELLQTVNVFAHTLLLHNHAACKTLPIFVVIHRHYAKYTVVKLNNKCRYIMMTIANNNIPFLSWKNTNSSSCQIIHLWIPKLLPIILVVFIASPSWKLHINNKYIILGSRLINAYLNRLNQKLKP